MNRHLYSIGKMARYLWPNLVNLFFLIFFVKTENRLCYEIKMGPSGYSNYLVGDLFEICPFNGNISNHQKPVKMKLSANWQANALIIFPGSPYAEYITEDVNEYNDLNCTFIIEAPMGESLFASVQSITFEKKDDCPSYVKFTPKVGSPSGKICGYSRKNTKNDFWEKFTPLIDNEKISNNWNNYSDANFGAHSPIGKIKTEIFVPNWDLWSDALNGLVIVYTPYKQYLPSGRYSAYLRSLNINMRREYVCDGVENCHELCKDENNCSTNNISEIFYVLFFGISFGIGVIAFWICRKQKMLCCNIWKPACSQNRTLNTVSVNTENYEISIRQSSRDHICSQRPDSLPSYESLFPTPPNSANSN